MNKIKRFIFKLTFNASDRRDIYESFRGYQMDNLSAEDTFDRLISVYSRRGKKPNQPIALILAECKGNLAAGSNVANSFSEWFPEDEVSILNSCERAGNLIKGFENASSFASQMVAISDAKKSTRNTFLYMSFLTFGLIIMFCMMMVPAIQLFVPIEQWSGMELSLWYLYVGIRDFWFFLFLFAVVLIVLLNRSYNRWTGVLRNKADNYFPYSVHKRIQGSIFIMNMNAMLSADIPMEEAVESLIEYTNSAWMRERLEAISGAIKSGDKNLGTALDSTGFEFPSVDAIIKMQSLFDTKNGIKSMERFSDEWMKKTVLSLEHLSTIVRVGSMFACGGSIMFLVSVMSNLLQNISSF
ncbi:type II secretion system F family protein [Escherichia coli]